MADRDRRAQDEREGLPVSGQAPQREPARSEPAARQTDPKLPVPFSPRFRWRPDATDFPVSLSEPTRAAEQTSAPTRRAGPAEPEWPRIHPPSDELVVFRDRSRFLPVAIIALVVVGAFATYLWQRDGDGETPVATQTALAGATTTSPSLLGASPTQPPEGGGSQVPGQGGARPVVTPTVEGDGTPTGDAPGETPVEEPTGDVTGEAGIVTINVPEGLTTIGLSTNTGLSVATLLWANPSVEDPNDPIPTDLAVDVPPTDGVVHTISEGETLEQIAAMYGVTPDDIIGWAPNGIAGNADLVVGARIVVPGGRPECRPTLAHYTVREGDDLWLVAAYYGLNGATVAFANELPSTDTISVGQELIIPPGDGVLVTVVEGDSVESLGSYLGVDPARIRACSFNGLSGAQQPSVGQLLFVPGADPAQFGVTPELPSAAGSGDPTVAPEPESQVYDPFAATPTPTPVPEASGSFIWPAVGAISTGFSREHNGIDIASGEGSDIVAADGGVVIFAGWNDNGLGYAVAIDHENGYVSWYGHLSAPPSVAVGDRVNQGAYLGPMGATGKATGPHLHFILMQDGEFQDPVELLPRG